jgi:hypothetical protein
VAISFPTSLDNFTNPSSGNTLDSPSHSLQHSDINDAVEAMQRKVGVGTAVAGSASAGQVLTISAAGTSTWSTPTAPALVQIIPSSISVGSGSGSVDANGAVTFTSASSVSLNDVFSTNYDNYYLIGNLSTTGGDASLRWRVSGADNSTSNYQYGLARKDFGAANFVNDTQSTTATSTFGAVNPGTNVAGFWKNINSPFLSQRTTLIGHTLSSSGYAYYDSHLFNATTSFTGFSLLCSSTFTMTGTIRIYGYRN